MMVLRPAMVVRRLTEVLEMCCGACAMEVGVSQCPLASSCSTSQELNCGARDRRGYVGIGVQVEGRCLDVGSMCSREAGLADLELGHSRR